MTRLFRSLWLLTLLFCAWACSTGGSGSSTSRSSVYNRNTKTTQNDDDSKSLLTSSAIPAEFQIKDGPVAIKNSLVEYGTGKNGVLKGYLAIPQTSAGISGHYLIVVHGKSGLSIAFQDMLKRFAGLNYPVLAINLFGSSKPPQDSKEADAMMADVKLGGDSQTLTNIEQAGKYLIEEKGAKTINLIGFGDGGSYAVKASLNFKMRYKALVNFYGAVETLKDQQNNITNASLHFIPLKDDSLDQDLVRTLEGTIKNNPLVNNQDVRLILLPEIKPGFFEPYDANYDKSQAESAMTELKAFFSRTFTN